MREAGNEGLLRDVGARLLVDLTGCPRWRELDAEAARRALAAMEALERGAVANPDEGRRVGHYWLRDPPRAPDAETARAIEASWALLRGLDAADAEQVLWLGIGGSALGPQFLHGALGPGPRAWRFVDNTDPEGIAEALDAIRPDRTLVVVVSKSGGTVETRNAMEAARARFRAAGVAWAPRAVAVTMPGSALDRLAAGHDADPPWRARLPVWEWVGGRTSITGSPGLLALRLLGRDPDAFLAGAAAADRWTRRPAGANPALALAAAWHAYGSGRGDRALVVLPYRDRLLLLGRYLQQLVMESLGKREDRRGRVVEQGLAVYGNKGSTDQHAFVQQLRDGRDDAFAHLVDVLDPGAAVPLPDGTDAGDHLVGFLLGTRRALLDRGRPVARVQLDALDEHALGALVALFERAVGFYAELIDVNAYHQPGVEAGKRAARASIALLGRLRAALGPRPRPAAELAAELGADPLECWRLLHHLAATGRARAERAAAPLDDRFTAPHHRSQEDDPR